MFCNNSQLDQKITKQLANYQDKSVSANYDNDEIENDVWDDDVS